MMRLRALVKIGNVRACRECLYHSSRGIPLKIRSKKKIIKKKRESDMDEEISFA